MPTAHPSSSPLQLLKTRLPATTISISWLLPRPMHKPLNLTRGFAGQLRAQGLYFTPDGSFVAPAAVGTRNTVVRIALDAKAQPTPIDLGAAVVSGLNTNRKQTGWVWLADSGGHPMQLCYAAKLGDPCSVLPTPELGPANLRTVAPQLVRWKSGTFTIEGLLYLPPDSGSAKVPLVVDVHGGPFGAWEDRNDPFADFLIGHGWAVLRPNPRGSSNYGVKFAAANKNDLGGGDYQDVMAGVDYVLANYPIDSTKLALMGYSYGGEMAGFVEGKTDRFKAVISGAPVIDQFSEYGTEGGSWYDRWYFGKPWEHMNDAWRQSPLAGVAHAKTPFLHPARRKRHHRSARPGAGDVSRPSSGRRPRRTRHLSARKPRPARHRHARSPLARTLARLRRPPAHRQLHHRSILPNSASINSARQNSNGSAE